VPRLFGRIVATFLRPRILAKISQILAKIVSILAKILCDNNAEALAKKGCGRMLRAWNVSLVRSEYKAQTY
jgi:hypothetical protein